MIDHRVATELLLTLLDGTTDANAMRRNGKPCRVVLPEDQDGRTTLVRAHLNGEPATLTFRANGRDPWRERVDAVILAAFCPDADARCCWIAIDLDAADHGEGGLADPVLAARVLAERADAAGLATGLLVAHSRDGRGRHVFLILPMPVPLPAAREYAAEGGGVIVDPFRDQPIQHECVPRCDHVAWSTFIEESRAALALRRTADVSYVRPRTKYIETLRPIDRIDARTRTFLAGDAPEGTRNLSAFAASANLLGCGIEEREAERMILDGAAACGLSECEARAAFSSAAGVLARKRRGQ